MSMKTIVSVSMGLVALVCFATAWVLFVVPPELRSVSHPSVSVDGVIVTVKHGAFTFVTNVAPPVYTMDSLFKGMQHWVSFGEGFFACERFKNAGASNAFDAIAYMEKAFADYTNSSPIFK